MVKIVATFSVPGYGIDAYTAGDIIARLKRIQGVTGCHIYTITTPPQIPSMSSALQKTPEYSLEIEASEISAMLTQVMNGLYIENQEYVDKLQVRTYTLMV